MDEKKILERAWLYTLELWANEKKKLEELPLNSIVKQREQKLWKEQEDLHDKLLKYEMEDHD